MLHPSEWKLWNENDVVFRKRELVIEILLEKFDAFAVETEYLGSVRFELRGLRTTNIDFGNRRIRQRLTHSQLHSAKRIVFSWVLVALEGSGRESKHVRADRPCC